MPKIKKPATAAIESAAPLLPPKGKLGILVGLLSRAGGADIAEMTAATGWQAHSVRGALSGSLKKLHYIKIASESLDGRRVYRIVGDAA